MHTQNGPYTPASPFASARPLPREGSSRLTRHGEACSGTMDWYAWPAGPAWTPACNARVDALRQRMITWEEATLGTQLCRNYDPAYLISVFLPTIEDEDFLFLTARFAYRVFTLDTLLEDYSAWMPEAQLRELLDYFIMMCGGPEVRPPSDPRLRLYGEQLGDNWREFEAYFPSPRHREAMRRTLETYFRHAVTLEDQARARGDFSLDEYRAFRPHTIQSIMGFDVINFFYPLQDGDMELLEDFRLNASLLTGIVNDVTSFPREGEPSDQVSGVNLVHWMMREHGHSQSSAVAAVVGYANDVVRWCESFLAELEAKTPRLVPLAEAYIKATVGECMYFHTATRYLDDEGVAAEAA